MNHSLMSFIYFYNSNLKYLFSKIWCFCLVTHFSLVSRLFYYMWYILWSMLLRDVPVVLCYDGEQEGPSLVDNSVRREGEESWSSWVYRNRYPLMICGVFLAIGVCIYLDIPVPIMPPVLPDIDIDHTQSINVEHTDTDVSECSTGISVSNDTEVPSEYQNKEIQNDVMFLRIEISSVLSELEELDQEYAKVLNDKNLSYAMKQSKLYVIESQRMLAVQEKDILYGRVVALEEALSKSNK